MRKILNDRMSLFSGIYLEDLDYFKRALKCLVGDGKFHLIWCNDGSYIWSYGRYTMTLDRDKAGTALLSVYSGKPVESEECDFTPLPWGKDHLLVLSTDQVDSSILYDLSDFLVS